MFKLFTILYFGAALSAVSASAQISPSTDSQPNFSGCGPVAYVYVASYRGNKKPNVIVGYSASSKDALTPLPGSPFKQNVGAMAVNGKYLMAVNNSNLPDIDTLKIGSNEHPVRRPAF